MKASCGTPASRAAIICGGRRRARPATPRLLGCTPAILLTTPAQLEVVLGNHRKFRRSPPAHLEAVPPRSGLVSPLRLAGVPQQIRRPPQQRCGAARGLRRQDAGVSHGALVHAFAGSRPSRVTRPSGGALRGVRPSPRTAAAWHRVCSSVAHSRRAGRFERLAGAGRRPPRRRSSCGDDQRAAASAHLLWRTPRRVRWRSIARALRERRHPPAVEFGPRPCGARCALRDDGEDVVARSARRADPLRETQQRPFSP